MAQGQNKYDDTGQSLGSEAGSEGKCSGDFLFVESSHPVKMLSGLNDLRKETSLCDITICVGEKEITCHKVVLASFSPYFKAMFSSNFSESWQDKKITLHFEIDPCMLELLIDYAYTSQIKITKENVQGLLEVADMLAVQPVHEACFEFMLTNIDDSNCIGIYSLACHFSCPQQFQFMSKEYIIKQFTNVCQQDEILTISKQRLIDIISNDRLVVDTEERVFQSVIRWLEYDQDTRFETIPEVMEHVRLPLLSQEFLNDAAKMEILKGKACCDLLEEAVASQKLMPHQRDLKQTKQMTPRHLSVVYPDGLAFFDMAWIQESNGSVPDHAVYVTDVTNHDYYIVRVEHHGIYYPGKLCQRHGHAHFAIQVEGELTSNNYEVLQHLPTSLVRLFWTEPTWKGLNTSQPSIVFPHCIVSGGQTKTESGSIPMFIAIGETIEGEHPGYARPIDQFATIPWRGSALKVSNLNSSPIPGCIPDVGFSVLVAIPRLPLDTSTSSEQMQPALVDPEAHSMANHWPPFWGNPSPV